MVHYARVSRETEISVRTATEFDTGRIRFKKRFTIQIIKKFVEYIGPRPRAIILLIPVVDPFEDPGTSFPPPSKVVRRLYDK